MMVGGHRAVRIGIVGVNMDHARMFAGLINGQPGSPPAVPGAEVTTIWGDDVGDGERTPASPEQVAARVPGPSGELARQIAGEYGIPAVATYPEDMVAATDLAIIVDDTGHGTSHAALATPFLRAGVATLIDKPMTLSVREAAELFALADRHAAPLMSASALRYAPGLSSLAGDAPSASFYAVSDGRWSYYGVHLGEMLAVAGCGRPRQVRLIASALRDVAFVEFASSTAVIDLVRGSALHGHRLERRDRDGSRAVEVLPTGYDWIFTRLLNDAVGMARSRVAPITATATLEILGLLALGVESADRDGTPVEWASARSLQGLELGDPSTPLGSR